MDANADANTLQCVSSFFLLICVFCGYYRIQDWSREENLVKNMDDMSKLTRSNLANFIKRYKLLYSISCSLLCMSVSMITKKINLGT